MGKRKNRFDMARKKKSVEDIYYPVPQDFSLIKADGPPENKEVVKRIIQGAVRVAYSLKNPDQWDYHGNWIKPKAVATDEQMEMVIHLIWSLQPTDAIEATLASQYAITYIQAMEARYFSDGTPLLKLDLFEFGHKVLETLQKYRSRGAQQIHVQYNVNRGQVVNIKTGEKSEQPVTLDAGEL